MLKNRADLVIFWGANPLECHPRHPTRYSVTTRGLFTPKGKKDRRVVNVDVRPTATSRMANTVIQVNPGSDYEIFSVLRALAKGHDPSVQEVGGVPMEQWKALLDAMTTCRFGAICWGMGLTMSRGKVFNLIALSELVHELNRFTKFVAFPMRGHGNVVGISQVMTWQTGYPFAVDFSRGYPRYGPGEYSMADVLANREIDVAMIMASDVMNSVPGGMADFLASVPLIAVDPHESETTKAATVVIPAAQAGIAAAGMCYRMDHIPLNLKKVVDVPYPSDREILERIIERVCALKANRSVHMAPAAHA